MSIFHKKYKQKDSSSKNSLMQLKLWRNWEIRAVRVCIQECNEAERLINRRELCQQSCHSTAKRKQLNRDQIGYQYVRLTSTVKFAQGNIRNDGTSFGTWRKNSRIKMYRTLYFHIFQIGTRLWIINPLPCDPLYHFTE